MLIFFIFHSATAQSIQTMIIGRVLAGIGIGISSAIVPLYISEVHIVLPVVYYFFLSACFYIADTLSMIRSHLQKFVARLDRSTSYSYVLVSLQHW